MNAALMEILDNFERGLLTRRQLIVRLLAAGGAMSASRGMALAGPPATGGQPTFEAKGLNHIALNVTDLARSRAFYEKHLGMTVMSESEHNCFMRCGRDWIALFKADQRGLDHYCYTIDDYSPEKAVATLKKAGLEPRRRENRVYFDDPDGIEVQLAS